MEPWQSWAIALVGAAAIYYYYLNQAKPKANRTRSASVSDLVTPQPKAARRRDSTRVKPKTDATKATGVTLPQLNVESGEDSMTAKGSEPTKKRKAGKKPAPSPAPALPVPAAKRQERDDDAQEEDNKAWAQQLASLKKGTSLAPPTRTDSRNKTVKQSAATFSSASSNAADADDDLTPAMSPSLAAGDVSDMLEPTASGPSVIRLTGSSKPTKAKQPQQSSSQVEETKKQRQNRKKVEERKLQREAEEKERQKLMEATRRAAREARGEPAKNGIPVSKPPASSAWAEQTAARALAPPAAVPANGESVPMLDTFDDSTQDDSGWNTVAKGKKQKKKGAVVGSEDSNTSDAGSVQNAVTEKAVPAPVPVAAPAPSTKQTSASSNGYSSLYDSGYDAGSHPDDSQWDA